MVVCEHACRVPINCKSREDRNCPVQQGVRLLENLRERRSSFFELSLAGRGKSENRLSIIIND